MRCEYKMNKLLKSILYGFFVALVATCVVALIGYSGFLIGEGSFLYGAFYGFLSVFIMITFINYYLR
jgi:hypothetical protein